MKTTFLQIALAVCAAGAAPSYAQYAAPSGGYRAPVYSPSVQQPTGRGVPQFTAARPSNTTAPAVPSFKPVNPPSQATQRILVASKTPNTPPAKVASQPTYQPSGDWAAPTPSMGSNYGGGYAGGPAPVAQGGGDCGCNGGGGAVSYGGGDCGGCAPSCGLGCFRGCGCCLAGHTCCVPFKGTGDLVQHMPFFGTTHGYYYFRPYHVMHVFSQQELATRWGGDARNPYDNSMFEKVYQQLGVDARSAQPTTGVSPAPALPTYPTPVPQYQPVPQMAPGTVVPSQPSGEFVPVR